VRVLQEVKGVNEANKLLQGLEVRQNLKKGLNKAHPVGKIHSKRRRLAPL